MSARPSMRGMVIARYGKRLTRDNIDKNDLSGMRNEVS